MLSILKWLVFLPASFASSVAAWLVAPIAPFFAHNYSLRGTWLWWSTTPNTDLRGDPDHQEKYHHKNSYIQQVHWIIRNPAVNFQREYLGVEFTPDDEYHQCHRPLSNGGEWKREYLKRDGKLIAWMLYLVWVYPFKKDKAFRLLLGWKCWDFMSKNPLQHTCRITIWKSV